jgi:hypothetical protein
MIGMIAQEVAQQPARLVFVPVAQRVSDRVHAYAQGARLDFAHDEPRSGRHVAALHDRARGEAHGDALGGACGAQAHVDARGPAREVGDARAHLLRLAATLGLDLDARAVGERVAARAAGLDHQEAAHRLGLVPQQQRLAPVDPHDPVHASVLVQIGRQHRPRDPGPVERPTGSGRQVEEALAGAPEQLRLLGHELRRIRGLLEGAAVDHEEVRTAVVVDLRPVAAPAHPPASGRAEPGLDRGVLEHEAVRELLEERVLLGLPVRDEDVEVQVQVRVADRQAHGPQRVGGARRVRDVLEGLPPTAPEERVVGDVVGHVDVLEAVPVQVREHGPQPASRGVVHAQLLGGLAEVPATVVDEQEVGCRQEGRGVERGRQALGAAPAGRGGHALVGHDVARHVQVEVAVPVGVAPAGARAEAVAAGAGALAHVHETEGPVVAQQERAPVAREEEVEVAVALHVAHRHAHAVQRRQERRALEAHAAQVAPDLGGGGGLRQRPRLHEDQVEQPVGVEVRRRQARTHVLAQLVRAYTREVAEAQGHGPEAGRRGRGGEQRRPVVRHAGHAPHGGRRRRASQQPGARESGASQHDEREGSPGEQASALGVHGPLSTRTTAVADPMSVIGARSWPSGLSMLSRAWLTLR